jgi:lysozyme
MMTTSPQGVAAIARHEGIVLEPYLDVAGVWTIGIGHTASAGDPDPATSGPITLDQAISIFRRDLAKFEDRVRTAVKVYLAQHEFDALVSFDFNTGGIYRAELTKALNRGDKAAAAEGFMGWRRPPAIIPRRQAEQRLFRTGSYPTGGVPIWSVSASKRPAKIVRSIPQEDVVALMEPAMSQRDEALTLINAAMQMLEKAKGMLA